MPRPNTGPALKWLAKRSSFYIVWYEQGRQRTRATGTTDRRQAEKVLAEFIGTSHRPLSGPRDPDEVVVADALAHYGEHHGPTTKDPVRIAYAMQALLPFWGEKRISEITASTVAAYGVERGVKTATLRRELATLSAAIGFLFKERLLTSKVPVPLPQKPKGRDRWLTQGEAVRLLNASRQCGRNGRSYLPLFILIALYTGARKEAVLSLRWPQVNLEAGRIDFGRPDGTTTKKGRALLPIPARLMTFLKLAWRRRSCDIGPVIHDNGRALLKIDKGFRQAVRRAGLEGVTPHTLRHTRGTWLAQAGVPLFEIAGWLGQTNATTAELYSHHSPDFMASALRAADRRKGV
jgi:integrase